ncbi:MAG: DUF433 domain-containing protein [Chloroflexi bacterium]|nr:MAG: DUF433 domain-containing protein [Chloroflexota bacterium]
MSESMNAVIDLLERPLYSMPQVDRLLALPPRTAKRWIDGYQRRGRLYDPVIRLEPTGDEIVTWGEFVEARFLAEYRTKGVPMVRMRPAIMELRKEFGKYPLAHARPFVDGKELVLKVQEAVGLERALVMVVVRSGQLMLSDAANHFLQSVEYGSDDDPIVHRIHPLTGNHTVVVDPLRQFGEPVVRSVPTAVIAELFDAGDSVESIADLYELERDDVEAALRYERERIKSQNPTAA